MERVKTDSGTFVSKEGDIMCLSKRSADRFWSVSVHSIVLFHRHNESLINIVTHNVWSIAWTEFNTEYKTVSQLIVEL